MTKVLGKTVRKPVKKLDTIPVPKGLEVGLFCREVTARCPVTGQPDFYTVRIWYISRGKGIESKSLKLYLWGFREKGIFAESLSQEIYHRVVTDINPEACKVTVIQSPRGGIEIEATYGV